MATFNSYHKWLGISLKEQPPNSYRLLGIDVFESDPEVIEAAADRQMAFVQQCATGVHVEELQRLLNELSQARVCLLNQEKRAKYDAKLRSQLSFGFTSDHSGQEAATESVPVIQTVDFDRIRQRQSLWSSPKFLGLIGTAIVLTLVIGVLLNRDAGNGNSDRTKQSLAQESGEQRLGQSTTKPTSSSSSTNPDNTRSLSENNSDLKNVLRFTGRDFVELKNTQGMLDLSGEFTIELWAKVDRNQGWQYLAGDDLWPTMSPKVPATANCGWVLRLHDGLLDFTVGAGGDDWVSTQKRHNELASWNHFAVCKKSNTVSLFQNGKLLVSVDHADATFVPSSTNLFLGVRRHSKPDYVFDGQIRAFQISSTCRYERAFSPPWEFKKDKATMVLLDFAQIENDHILDISGFAHHGVLHNYPPGVVINQSPDPKNQYVGCPSIVIMPNGDYVASHSWFGPGTPNNETLVFRSKNRGQTWNRISHIDGQWWSSLFVHHNKLYIMGVSGKYGQAVIRRSDDSGETWTIPTNKTTGLLDDTVRYHSSSVPIVVHKGRIWRSYEDTEASGGWPRFLRTLVFSAPVDTDLLNGNNWQATEYPLKSDPKQIAGKEAGWLEGNLVVTPNDQLVNILRVNGRKSTAAITRISLDGKIEFEPQTGLIVFPGGSSKFSIRYDPRSKRYWSLVNRQFSPVAYRNVLALTSSADLRKWQTNSFILRHADKKHHAWQYVDWQFDGEDLIAVSRTAWDNSKNAQDANYLTFHRIERFRGLTLHDSPPWIGFGKLTTFQNSRYEIRGQNMSMKKLQNESQAFGNRKYTWFNVPEAIKGYRYTQTNGGVLTGITVKAQKRCEILVATALNQSPVDLTGWTKVKNMKFNYTDRKRSAMHIFRRTLDRNEEIYLGRTNWTGWLVLIPPETK